MEWKVSDTGSANWASSSFGHCDVCPTSIYVFWLPLSYLQTLLTVQDERRNLFNANSKLLFIFTLINTAYKTVIHMVLWYYNHNKNSVSSRHLWLLFINTFNCFVTFSEQYFSIFVASLDCLFCLKVIFNKSHFNKSCYCLIW